MAKSAKPKCEEEKYAVMFPPRGTIRCPKCGAVATLVVGMNDVVEWLQNKPLRTRI